MAIGATLKGHMKLCEIHAREKSGMPPEWCAYAWECFPKEPNQKVLYYQIKGMVAPIKTKGPRKGDHNWKAGDKSTERVVILPVEEHEQWIRKWESSTGKCSNCIGDGKVIVKWSSITGIHYGECTICKGTGSKPAGRPHEEGTE